MQIPHRALRIEAGGANLPTPLRSRLTVNLLPGLLGSIMNSTRFSRPLFPRASTVLGPVLALVTLSVTAVWASPAFHAAWYYEVMLGEVSTALQRYQDIVRDPSLPIEMRRKAFLRAGRCAEKLGRTPVAVRNFRQVIENARPLPGKRKEDADALSRTAAARLRILAGERGRNDQDTATLGRLEAQLQRVLDTRSAARAAVSEILRRQEAAAASTARIEDRLAAVGASFDWSPEPGETALDWDPSLTSTSSVDYLTSLGLTDDDTALLRAELAHRFYVRGVRALAGLELKGAIEHLRSHIALADHVRMDAVRLVESIQELLADARGLIRETDELLREEVGRRGSEVLRGIHSLRLDADLDVPGTKLDELVGVELREDWAPSAMLSGGRLREHAVGSARSLNALQAASSDKKFETLQSECQRTARELARDLERLFLLQRDPTAEHRPRLEDPEKMLPLVKRHVEDVLARSATGDLSATQSRELLEDSMRLVEWFSEIDPTESYRNALRRQLSR